jgi:hypothetical protein
MFHRTPVFRAVNPELVGAGIEPDVHPLLRGLWESASNVTFFNGRVRRRYSPQQLFSAGLGSVRGLMQLQDNNGVRWVWAAAGSNVTRWYGPAAEVLLSAEVTQVNATATGPATQWDFTPFGEWMVLNKSAGAVRIYKPATGIAVLGNCPIDVVTMAKKFNFMLAIGHGAAKRQVSWSDADAIENWTATSTNLAGSLSIEELNTPIRAAKHLGQSIAIMAEDQIALLNYIGAPFYFGQKVVLDNVGCVGKAAAVSDGRNLFGFGVGGFWWSDGVSAKYLDDLKMQTYFQENVNWEQASKIVVARNDYTTCIEIAMPVRGSLEVNEAWSFDPRMSAWTPITPFTAKMDRRLFTKPLDGTAAGAVRIDATDKLSAAPLALRTKPLLKQLQDGTGLSDSHTNSRVDEVDLLLHKAVGIEFRVGSSQEQATGYTYTSWLACSEGNAVYKLPAGFPDGVYHVLEFRSTLPAWEFDLQGFVLFGTIEGSKRGSA